MDAVLFLKQLVGSLTLPVKNGNLVKTATVIEEVQEALGNVAVIQGG